MRAIDLVHTPSRQHSSSVFFYFFSLPSAWSGGLVVCEPGSGKKKVGNCVAECACRSQPPTPVAPPWHFLPSRTPHMPRRGGGARWELDSRSPPSSGQSETPVATTPAAGTLSTGRPFPAARLGGCAAGDWLRPFDGAASGLAAPATRTAATAPGDWEDMQSACRFFVTLLMKPLTSRRLFFPCFFSCLPYYVLINGSGFAEEKK